MDMKMLFKRILSAVITAAMIPISIAFAADSGLENVALNKTVYSSGYFSNVWNEAAAVDGDLNKGYASGSHAPERELKLADGEARGIMIDLEEFCLVSEIDVRTRRDIDQPYSRRGWQVYVSDNIEFNNAELVGTKMIAGAFGEDLEIKLSSPKKIRYIKMVSNTDIVLSEIEAWGIPIGDGAGFADYSDMEASNASYLLSYLEIINNSSNYEPLKLVTRKEAAEFLMKLTNNTTESDKVYFDDVSAEDDYAKIIAACCESGIIKQADEFRPDDFVSEYEFLVMILRALGYNETIGVDAASQMSVRIKANELKLLKNTDFGKSEYVNRENAMWIMYNALNTPVARWSYNSNSSLEYKEGECLLEEAFNLVLKKGVVTANNETTLSELAANADDYIAVDGVSYQDESKTLYKNLGERIVFGVDKEEDSVIKFGYQDFEKNSVITIPCDDLDDVTGKIVSCDVNGVIKKYKLDDTIILKNHVAFSEYRMELSYFNRPDSYLELTDNDGDGAYEVINIIEPTVIEAEKILFTNGMSIIANGGEKYEFNDYDNLILTINGRNASEKSFMNSGLVLLYASKDRKNVYADGYSTTCSGTVEAKTGDTVKIDGETYRFSDYFVSKYSISDKFVLGNSVMAYCVSDKIFFVKSGVVNTTETIGFVLRTKITEDEDALILRIYTINGTFAEVNTGDKLTVDGVKWSQDKLINNSKYFNEKFVKFKTNSQNVLTWIDTENYTKANEPDSDMQVIEDITTSCRKNVDGIWSGFAMIAAVKADAPMFMIPLINGRYGTDEETEKYYSISKFSNVYAYNGQSVNENTKFYGKDDNGYVKFGVSVKNVPIISGSYAPCSSAASPIIVLSDIEQGINDDDEVVNVINGYDLSTGNSVSYTTPAGMEYVVDLPSIVNDGASELYDKSSNMGLRSAIVPDKYLYSIAGLKNGCILRAEVSDKQITGLDLISDGDWSKLLNYTYLNGLDTIYSGYLAMNITMEKISDEILTYNTGYGSAIKSYNEFLTMIVVDGKNVSRVNVSDFSKYFASGKNAFVLFNSGKAIGIVVKED